MDTLEDRGMARHLHCAESREECESQVQALKKVMSRRVPIYRVGKTIEA